MRREYNFSAARRNPYAKRLKKPITIRLDRETIEYFKGLANDTGIAYQQAPLTSLGASRRLTSHSAPGSYGPIVRVSLPHPAPGLDCRDPAGGEGSLSHLDLQ